ncbi:staphyloferrin B biosynthesis decarboxylase SbnH [Phytohabitans flavus]|uniref:Staphyloferrin B biosynthesis decarboxylase SbnH n=1 Tax=Phytohabitans flavus TaxID=1076124 RepID=A0A6F8XQC3_9ACTN|nr:alanine racemase [Phytohabitans flavus]BCB76007.1 staphyloferrin B biosynthesis decarboxylase SbnH [Phytohabitans flavus]
MLPEPVRAALAGLPSPACAYVYDTAVLRATAATLRAALPAGATLLYAVKANGHPSVVQALADVCDGLEVASGGELSLAVECGARLVAFGGPAKTDDELRAAVAAGALIHVESVLELRRLAALSSGPPLGPHSGPHSGPPSGPHSGPLEIALRVNRAGGTLGGTHRMTGTPTPFGIEEAQLPAAAALAAALPHLRVVGFHLHAVSNNLDAEAHTTFVDEAVRWSVDTAARLGIPLSYVNVGGGLGIDYTGGPPFDLERLRAQAPPPGVRLAFEPGRFLAADAGWYAAEVLDLKHTHGRWFAVLRGGTHHFRLPAAWGYSHPFTVLPRDEWRYDFPRPEIRDTEVDAVGELCTPRDVLTRAQHVDRLRVGDVLVFANAGAYGWDISHHDYLRHPHPAMLVV